MKQDKPYRIAMRVLDVMGPWGGMKALTDMILDAYDWSGGMVHIHYADFYMLSEYLEEIGHEKGDWDEGR